MPDNLTMTVAVGASLFDERFGLAGAAPEAPRRHDALSRTTRSTRDCCHGDLLVQFCANTAETNIHALRAVLKDFPDLLAHALEEDGFLPPHTIKKLGPGHGPQPARLQGRHRQPRRPRRRR